MAKVSTTFYDDIALLPLQPETPLRESLEWKTDLMESYNGTEQALQLRGSPRQKFTFKFTEQAWTKNLGFNVEYGAIQERWGIPLWMEAQYLGTVSAAITALPCTVDVYDFRDSSLALLWQSPTQWQVIEITTVGAGVLNLDTATNAFTRAWLMPLRVGRTSGQLQRNSNGHNVQLTANFEIEDNLALSSSAPTQYLSQDIYFEPPIMDGDRMLYGIETRTDVVDYELGIVARRTPWQYNRVNRPFNVICEGATEVRAFREWLMRRAGKYRRFWEPSFENDFRKQSTGTVNSTILVGRDGLDDWAPQRSHIAVELDDGSWLARALTSITPTSSTQAQLNLSTSLGGIAASRIRRISWLGLKRLDTDLVEMNWVGGGIMQAAVTVAEIQP